MKQAIIVLILLNAQAIFAQDTVLIEKVPRNPYFKYVQITAEDSITYYLSEFDREKKLPLIVYVQGSGYHSLFTEKEGAVRPTSGHSSLPYLAQGKAKILIVEKPGVRYLDNMAPDRRNIKFDTSFSLENWSKRIESVTHEVLSKENIDTSKIMVIGHSEGGIAAARVANRMHQKVNYVCIMAGEGPSQLYSLYTFARSGEFFSEKGATDRERTDFVVEKWKDIIQSPYSTDKYFWGFTYLRWYSFLSTSVIDELSQYKGSVLILQGEEDKNVNPETAVIAYASLLSKGVDVTLKMYPGADHSFYIKSGNGNGWETALKDALNWFF